jgi:hypothetical protein
LDFLQLPVLKRWLFWIFCQMNNPFRENQFWIP